MGILILISFGVLLTYITVSQYFFDTTSSLSATSYEWKNKKKGLEFLFTLGMWGTVFTLVPAWFDILPDDANVFIFFAGASLGFVGATPMFNNKDLEGKVHTAGAIGAILMSYLWSFLFADIILSAVAIALSVIIYAYNKKTYIYWIEMVAFANIFLQLYFLL